MQNSDNLVNTVEGKLRQTEARSSASQIAAGQGISERKKSYQSDSEPSSKAEKTAQRIEALTQVFAELELAYHNQFHKAYADQEALEMAKQLWFDALSSYSPQVILRACRQAIAESEYLPSLHMLLRQCGNQLASVGLPEIRAAYREACNAEEPKCNAPWSHPAVYYAAVDTDWFMLASESEARMLPVFERCYQRQCERVLAGEQLESPRRELISDSTVPAPLSKAENLRRLQALRNELNL